MRTSPFRLASALIASVFALWVVFATVVMPYLYQVVYSGGLPFLGRFLVRHRVENGVVNPLEAYLNEWSGMSQGWTVSFLGSGCSPL